MMKNIAILGSTGSIGTQTLEVVSLHEDELNITSLSCGKNIDLLEKQIRRFKPNFVSVEKEEDALKLKEKIKDIDVKIFFGEDGLLKVAEDEKSDILVTGIVGMIGINPTLHAIRHKKDIALANKETLVCAGHIVMEEAKKNNVKIFPVDSEHSAIFQSLEGRHNNKIKKIILTASGGALLNTPKEKLSQVKLSDVLKNPNWDMGAKVTIDSAGLINKGLEVMEAIRLFNVKRKDIEVVVHPESILHSAVEYEDGSIIGEMAAADMRIPIQYALLYPKRVDSGFKTISFSDIGTLHFKKPDTDRFPGLLLAYKAADQGGNIPTIFNAANEQAVEFLLKRKIKFMDIPALINQAMDNIPFIDNPTVDMIIKTGEDTKNFVKDIVNHI